MTCMTSISVGETIWIGAFALPMALGSAVTRVVAQLEDRPIVAALAPRHV